MSLAMSIIIGISLSMDAFSLAMIYGTLNLEKKVIKELSLAVGIFHFFMPQIGFKIGKLILSIIKIKPDILVGIIFLFIALQMFFSLFKNEEVSALKGPLSLVLFAFTVSIDSFSVGIGLSGLIENIYIQGLIFSIISLLFTYLGLNLGTKLATKFGNITTLIGSILLFIMSLEYLFF